MSKLPTYHKASELPQILSNLAQQTIAESRRPTDTPFVKAVKAYLYEKDEDYRKLHHLREEVSQSIRSIYFMPETDTGHRAGMTSL